MFSMISLCFFLLCHSKYTKEHHSYRVLTRTAIKNHSKNQCTLDSNEYQRSNTGTNQGAWQAYDSFASSLDAHTTTTKTKKRNLNVVENKSPETSPKKKQRMSPPLSEEKTNEEGWKRKRRRSRQALNVDNLSEDEDVEIETKSQDNDDDEYGQTHDISGFRRRRRRRK